MDTSPQDPFFCAYAGAIDGNVACCGLHDSPSDYPCNFFLDPYWCRSGNCVQDCQSLDLLYNLPALFGSTQSTATANLYNTCLNLPLVLGYLKQGLLPIGPAATDYPQSLEQYFPLSTTNVELQNITSAVTHCLISSCDQARDAEACFTACSPAKLLINSTTPSFNGVSSCLGILCQNGNNGLPYANSDVLGIGVFSSYITQCAIVFLAWLLFAILDIVEHRKILSKGLEQREALVTGLVEFHKVQCFFSMALQIASLFAGVFHTNMLSAYMLLPLSMNGILPVLFAFLLLVQFGRASVYLTVLTGSSWLLATVVFWGLYTHVPLSSKAVDSGGVYTQFVSQLSANPACGGYSAQAVCANQALDFSAFEIAGSAVRFMPIVWIWCSLCFFSLVGHLLLRKTAGWKRFKSRITNHLSNFCTSFLRFCGFTFVGNDYDTFGVRAVIWATTLIFIACLGFQFYLFWTNLRLELINVHSWGFGQIIGVTVWFAPVIEYFYLLLNGMIEGSKYRLAKTLTVTRVSGSSTGSSDSSSPSHEGAPPGDSNILGASCVALRFQDSTSYHSTQQESGSPERSSGDRRDDLSEAVSAHAVTGFSNEVDEIFELRSRPTLRMEEGVAAVSNGRDSPSAPPRAATFGSIKR